MPSNLLIQPEAFTGRLATFGFEYLAFQNLKLVPGARQQSETAARELAIVVLGGTCSVTSSAGNWQNIGARAHVFAGLPYTLYLPINTSFEISTQAGCDLALCYSKAEQAYPPLLITPDQIEIEIRGGSNATRQINHIIKPTTHTHRLLVVEVYTPSGNWSSYPPHKHDVHNPPAEVDLEEIYYYRINPTKAQAPGGYAIQKVYTKDRRLDETLTVRDGQLVLVPEGYHPVVAAHGYDVYYLNALAGSAHSMAASDDPDYAWVRNEWKDKDPRLPLVM